MGPPPKVGTAAPRRCLLCRHDALSPAEQQKANVKLKRCATSLCTIFGLADTHPFKIIYERAQYCEPCLKEVQEADVTLGKLELMKQNLLRFQNRVYSKLGDNYFQIENREALKASYVDFEKGGEAMKGKKFSYDDIVKVVYEKLDKDCLKWERFSSEVATGVPTVVPPFKKREMATQTEVVASSQDQSSSGVHGVTSLVNNNDIPEVILPDDADDNPVWVGDDAGGDEGGVSDYDDATSSVGPDPLNVSSATTTTTVEIDYGPQAKGLPFTKAPINFENKIYCTVDPENCKRFFYDDYNLSVHVKSFHEGNPLPHECTVCKRGFVDEGRLKHHFLRVHVTSDACMCEHCGKGFPTPSVLREHVRKKHTNGKDLYNCSFCTAPFISQLDQKEHEDLHRSREVPFSCVFCDEVFPNSIVLRSHYFKMHVECKFTCHVCGKNLASENSLKTHLKMHTGEFQCEQCGFAGSSVNSLKNHMLTHSTEKPHTCELCGHAFKYIKNLTSHMRIHTGEKPYCCSICGMQFRELSYLRRHEESHTLGDNYQCPDCGAGFKVKENMTKHRRIHKEDYVPKKKKYKPRTEHQKMQRRLKRQMKVEADRRSPSRVKGGYKVKTTTTPRSLPAAGEETKTSPSILAKTRPKRGVKRKRAGRSPGPKSRKGSRQKAPSKKKREMKEEEEELLSEVEEDVDTMMLVEEKEEVVEESQIAYEIEAEDEVTTAVASIQESPAAQEDVYSNAVVYANHFQPQPLPPTTTAYIPVTVVNTQGAVKSASQLVVRTRTQLQQHQYQFL